ncbi:hypothetical protein HK104_009782 [Borealophlyctis nickersoniae]|nr:hypothetical protein HK104_009782 [Borealophlyctis nickersoniae]
MLSSESDSASSRGEDSRTSRKDKKKRRRRDRSGSRGDEKAGKRKHKKAKHRRKEPELTFDRSRKGQLVIEPQPFYIDRKGDRKNLEYGSLGRGNAPDYHRMGDTIWGLPDVWKIDTKSWRKGKDVIVRRVFPGSDRFVPKVTYEDFKHALRGKPVNIARLFKDLPPDDGIESQDFIAFPDIANILEKKGDSLVQLLEEDGGASIQEDAEFVRKTSHFNRQLQEQPKNLELWLGFVALQDSLVKDGQKKGSLKTVINEKKQTIYSKALEELPNNETLLLGYLKCCEETWETAKLLTKWDQVLKSNPGSFVLWNQYLTFRQTNYSSFTVSGCLELYEDCMRLLMLDRTSSRERKEEILLHIFFRACNLLAQSGFFEKAIGLLQGMVEFSCFCPPHVADQSFEQRLDKFEQFWESECPRFGEEGAVGWSSSLGREEDLAASSSNPRRIFQNPLSGDLNEWAQVEATEEFHNWLPLRPTTEDDVEDPYRAVLFEDIRGLIFDATLPATRQRLLHNLLCFLSVPMNGGISSSHAFFQDSFVHGEMANEVKALSFWPRDLSALAIESGTDSDQVNSNLLRDCFDFPLKVFPASDTAVLDETRWFVPFGSKDAKSVDQSGEGRKAFIRNIFDQAISIPSSDLQLSLWKLAFETGFSAKSGQKQAKGLLKSQRTNLLLWNLYAQIEVARGNVEEARKVYTTALSSYHSFPKAEQADAAFLYRALADLELETKHLDRGLAITVAMAEDRLDLNDSNLKPSPTRILKAKKVFSQRTQSLMAACELAVVTKLSRLTIDTMACYALFEYLTQGVEDACKMYDQSLEAVHARANGEATVLEELVFEEYVRLLFRHATGGGAFKPSTLRDVLERAMERFPNNTIFLSLYGWNEARTKIQNRVRRFLDSQLARHPSHVLWTFYIWSELHQRPPYNVHFVRSLFDRALECDSARHSTSVWYLYIQFEIREGNLPKAKALFFRAIRECPWCKDIYMIPFRALRAAFDDDELTDILSLMEEKELRIRRNLQAE